jgi:organic hydroperoxide reductase OsmC/OhrA
VASCYTLALYHVAHKRGVELVDLAVRAVGEYDGPRFVTVRVEVTSNHPRAELEPLLERASAVCYVSNTIRTVDDVAVVWADSSTG